MNTAAPGAVLLLGLAAAGAASEIAVYRARGSDASLFDQYDNDGYSLSVMATEDGAVELTVRVSDAPLRTRPVAPGPPQEDSPPPAAPERDAFVRDLVRGSPTREETVRRVVLALRERLVYDPDPLRLQDPAAVFASRRGYCVGFAELAVDLLRRAGISARTVQGILRAPPGSDHYEAAIGGAYHRWIEVYYPDRGYVFSDPWTSINGVDARYVPFARRALVRPRALSLETVEPPHGRLSYDTVKAGDGEMRVRRAAAR